MNSFQLKLEEQAARIKELEVENFKLITQQGNDIDTIRRVNEERQRLTDTNQRLNEMLVDLKDPSEEIKYLKKERDALDILWRAAAASVTDLTEANETLCQISADKDEQIRELSKDLLEQRKLVWDSADRINCCKNMDNHLRSQLKTAKAEYIELSKNYSTALDDCKRAREGGKVMMEEGERFMKAGRELEVSLERERRVVDALLNVIEEQL